MDDRIAPQLRSPHESSPFIEKPLPSPSIWGQASIGAARAHYGLRRCFFRDRRITFGWRSTITAGTVIAITVLAFNITLLVWASTQPWDPFTNTRTIANGNCEQTQNIFTYSHLAINLASTLLLATSNAAMQCLSAPTREAIDRAHAAGKWLDVGISGFRNWPYMDWWRQWCWIFLLLSTVPLHLFVLFSTSSGNEYFALFVPSNYSDSPVQLSNASSPMDQVLHNLTQLARDGKLVEKNREDCIKIYNQQLVTSYSNLLVVTTNASNAMPLWSFDFHPTPSVGDQSPVSDIGAWLCGEQACNKDWVAAHWEDWNITLASNHSSGPKPIYFVDHCLVQEVQSGCTIQFIPEIMATVIICNILKVFCFLAAVRMRTFQPLITIGDAICSFLDRPELETADLGPISAADIRDAETRAHIAKIARANKGPPASPTETRNEEINAIEKLPFRYGPWKSRPMRWFSGASRSRWNMTYALLVAVSAVGWTFFGIAANGGDSFQRQWSNGLGTVSLDSLLEGFSAGGIVGIVLLSNVFQLLLSLSYISFNGLFTSILISYEFASYAHKRAALRVSQPRGPYQRSSYWLSLPYRFAIPLLIISVLLHWTLSQSLFLAEIRIYTPQGYFDQLFSVSCLGYSSLSILITMLLAVILIISPLVLGWIRYRPGVPIVGSNTLAISAACHPLHGRPTESLMLLKYGAFGDINGMRVSLSSESVEPLIPGERYTKCDEINAQMLATGAVAAIRLTRWQVFWSRFLAALMVAKLVTFTVYTVEGVLTQTRASKNSFISGLDAPDTVISIIAIMTLIYVVFRGIISLVRTWQGKKLRHFWWHVATEIVLLVAWLVIFIWIVEYMQQNPNDPLLNSTLTSGATNFYIGISAGFMLCFLFSAVIEIGLWWQQFRPEVPFPLVHAALQASRWFGVRLSS